jgi:hypothetical protein
MLKDRLSELAILLAMLVSIIFFVPFSMHPPFFNPVSIPAFAAFVGLLYLAGVHSTKLWKSGKTKTTIAFIAVLLTLVVVSSAYFWEISEPGLV